ncbi:His Kinase A (phospho-acceptor) domain-containing protein [Hydrogenimonas thermophila]|uniref:histidine kinase n=1 Tax=Hydrogenimonas thermophila TaxID=223786 RepID=A0A1I5LVV8_9BACT|nr:His Kinase A (phospho-acceptor) domain-containing protein [Hydrogenimonas thermophila]
MLFQILGELGTALKNREIFKVLLFYVVTFVSMSGLMWVVFENFGYSNKNFLVVTAMLLPLAMLFGYILSKIALEPLFITNDLLDRLLKDTLHELNIPLSTIFANVSMLKRKESDPKKLVRLERIERAGENLKELYEDLDYFIKKEIGTVECETFDLNDVIKKSIAKIEGASEDITIQYTPESMVIIADRRGCQKAVDNLISNAVKYNRPKGFVKISIQNGWLVIEDSGIGMDETTLFHIFDRYYQSDLNASGYGIGLHIVKTFCDEHGIEISIDSKVDEGTTFRLGFEALKERSKN